MPVVLDVLHAGQACLSAYALYLSYISITDSQKYEEKTEKAAQYSRTAEHQLHKTRTTLTSGTAAVSPALYFHPMTLRCCSSDPPSSSSIPLPGKSCNNRPAYLKQQDAG